jgi:hypothetical protein
MYEKGSLDNVLTNFRLLLNAAATEETCQVFMEQNPILLHPFSPAETFFKAPILSLRRTDFAIVNHQKELLLVELEKPSTKIMKKDGGLHSELQHAFDQVHEWLHSADEHRAAVLECIGVDRRNVGAVRAVVIAGRDAEYDPEKLRRLKGVDYGRVRLLTYDDLLAALGALVRDIW